VKKLSTLIISSFLLSASVSANDSTLFDIVQFHINSYKTSYGSCNLPYPYGVLLNGNSIAKASLSENNAQHVTYNEAQFESLWGFKLSEGTGGAINLGYGMANIYWRQNPYFRQTVFPFYNVGISGYTDSISNWFWLTGINAQIQTNVGTDQLLTQRSRYSAMLWGRYEFCEPAGVHLGFLVFTGIMKTNVWPVIGFDWTFCKQWELNLVFPVNMSLFYNINNDWSFSIAARPFSARVRTESTEPSPSSIVEYRNNGTELSVNYNTNRILFSLYGGYSWGNMMKFEDENANLLEYRHFNGAPYAGFNLLFNF
jgi:hypothetical protein